MNADMAARIRRTRRLGAARLMTGKERRWINPDKGLIKIFERNLDLIVSRFLYPHLSRVWTPYSWLLERCFVLTETSVSPVGWPRTLDPLRVLLISDIHTGIFLKPQTLADLILSLMELTPDLVTIAGDIVTGHSSEVRPFLAALAPLSRAPLGAWYAYGNHDYSGGDPEELRKDLGSIGITTLKNESVALAHGHGRCVLGAIDDLIFGRPDWPRLLSQDGVPHLLLAHNPDHFYKAEGHGVPPDPFRPHSWRPDPVPPTGRQLSATAGSASMRDSFHSVLRCSWCRAGWGVSGSPGAGAPTQKRC